jgi:AcrR family transcriptional regulator
VTDSQSSIQADARHTRRAELLDAARGLFLARGYAATSVSAIVSAAGVAQGTFYLYFANKGQVLVHLRAEILRDLLTALEAGLAPTRRGEVADVRIVRGITRIHEVVARHRALVRVLHEASSSDELQRVWIEGRATLSRPLAALIEDGRRDGSFRVDDATMTAHLALSLFDDLLYEAFEFGAPADPATTLAHALRFFLRALGCPPARIDSLAPLPEVHRRA